MMHCALLLSAASLGVDYGWQHTDDGSLEYIIQLEPALLEALAAGEPILSEVHPDARGVTRFRILVGSDQLPREAAAARSDVLPGDVPLPGPETAAGETPGKSTAVPSLPDIASTPPQLPASDRPRDSESIQWPAVAPNFGGREFVPQTPEASRAAVSPAAPKTPPDSGAFPRMITPPSESDGRVNPIPDPDRSAGLPLSPPEVSSNESPSTPPVIEPPQRFTPQPPRDPNVQPAGGLHAPTSVAQASVNPTKEAPPKEPTSAGSPTSEESASPEPQRPWATLVVGAFLLCLSIAVNVYLGVLARGFYIRYRQLAQEIRNAPAVDGA